MCVAILEGQGVEIFEYRHVQKRLNRKERYFRLFDYGVKTLPSTLNSAGLKMELQQPKMSSCCQFTKLKAVFSVCVQNVAKYGRNKGGGA